MTQTTNSSTSGTEIDDGVTSASISEDGERLDCAWDYIHGKSYFLSDFLE